MSDDPANRKKMLVNAALEKHMDKMTAMARWALGNLRRGTGDADGAVASAARALLSNCKREDFSVPEDPDDLWKVLQSQLFRKIDSYRHQPRYKKNQGTRLGDLTSDEARFAWKEGFVAENISPEDVEEYIEAAMRLVDERIKDDKHRRLARLKIEGYSNKEIAERMDATESWVSRHLDDVRAQLQDLREPD